MNSRRIFLANAGTALAASTIVGATPINESKTERKRVLRIAHITDIHVQPERGAGLGMAACLQHLRSLSDKPELILNGGDSIMDSLEQPASRVKTQWDLFTKVLKDENAFSVKHCLGNHDAWGWIQTKSGALGTEPLYGKRWAQDVLALPNRYYSFAQAGWHFIVLDSTQSRGNAGYEARLDGEQYEWLRGELNAVKRETPILILSHIPILSMTAAFFLRKPDQNAEWTIPRNLMHADGLQLQQLFLQHPNVKVCLSGHTHLVDRVDYTGVTYFCNGAVSGGWWGGAWKECDPGYALVNLYDDGSFDREYVTYGWKARE